MKGDIVYSCSAPEILGFRWKFVNLLSEIWVENAPHGARSNFWGGRQGRRTGVGVTTVSNSLILGGWVTKDLKNDDKK